MHKRLRLRVSVALAVMVAAIGAVVLPLMAQPARVSPEPPASAPPPSAVHDLTGALRQTAAVAEGIVTDVTYEFSEEMGPWTITTLQSVKSHVGRANQAVVIRQFGGPLPDKSRLVVHDQPTFEKGGRYLVFLRNTAWHISPIVDRLAMRVDVSEGIERLTDTAGRPILGLDEGGLVVGSTATDGKDVGRADAARAQAVRSDTGSLVPAGEDATGKLAGLTRDEFVGRLRREIDARGLRVDGAVFDVPRRGGLWQGVSTKLVPEVTRREPGGANSVEPDVNKESADNGGKP